MARSAWQEPLLDTPARPIDGGGGGGSGLLSHAYRVELELLPPDALAVLLLLPAAAGAERHPFAELRLRVKPLDYVQVCT